MPLLDRVVRRIHDEHCRFRLSDDEVKDIEDMVLHLVKDLLPGRLLNDSGGRYSIAEVIEAGSYFEQTKIQLPNEFDFMLAVDQLSGEESIFLSQGCKPGYAHVRVTEPQIWDTTSCDDDPERRFEIALLQFNMYVRESLKLLLLEPLRGRFGQLEIKEIVVRGKPFKAFSHVQTLTLLYSELRCTDTVEPGTTLLYERLSTEQKTDIEVCVDLMSCCHLPLSAFKNILPEKCFENEALAANGCHVVLKSCESNSCVESQGKCRLISYTRTEQGCMKRLDVSWKVAYRMLKWLFQYTGVLEVDTYKIKTAVLHCSSARGQGEAVPVGEGLIAILRVLRKSAFSDNLPGYFNPSLNVWSVRPCYHYLVKYEMIFLLKLFTNIQKCRDEGQNVDVYLDVINAWIYSFCSHAVEISKMAKTSTSRLEQFNWQGNAFLDILKDVEPALKNNVIFSWIPFQLKCHVLCDVFKVLSLVFMDKIVSWLRLNIPLL